MNLNERKNGIFWRLKEKKRNVVNEDLENHNIFEKLEKEIANSPTITEDKNIETKDKDGNPRSIEEIYADLEKKYLQEKTNQTSRQAAENQQQSEEPDKQPEDQEK